MVIPSDVFFVVSGQVSVSVIFVRLLMLAIPVISKFLLLRYKVRLFPPDLRAKSKQTVRVHVTET